MAANFMLVRLLRWGLVGGLLLTTLAAPAQSRRLVSRWQQLAHEPRPTRVREQLLWHLAWENELPPRTRDSLAARAQLLARQLGDSAGLRTARVWAARRLVHAGQHEQAQARLLAALPAAAHQSDTWLHLQILLLLGRNQWGSTTHSRAEGYWLRAWALAQRQPDVALRARTAWLLGCFYGDYARALDWLFRSLALAEQADDQALQADVFGSLAYNYAALGELPQAQHYYGRALHLARQLGSPPVLCRALLNSSELYLEQGQYAQARRQYAEAAGWATTPDDHFTIATGLATTSNVQGLPGPALREARRGLALARSLHDVGGITTLYGTMARSFLLLGQPDSARWYGERAYVRRPGDSMQPIIAEVCQVLAQTYARQGDWAQAYQFQHRYQAYQDTLTSAQVRTRARQAQARYQRARQQARTQLQQRDQELARLRRQRTLAAAAVAGLLLAGAAGMGARAYRRRQSRRLVALRTHLAADLHDEVGTLLTRVSVQAELLRGLPADLQEAALERLLRNSRAAASTMRDVVWGIDARADSAGSLFDRMREYLDQTAAAAGWQTELSTTDWPDATPLPPAVRQSVYRIFKEAVTNAVRHAQGATLLRVQMSRRAGQLVLSIADDGVAQPAKPARTGMGLLNMAQRAVGLGGRLRAQVRAEGGFEVRLEVPLPG